MLWGDYYGYFFVLSGFCVVVFLWKLYCICSFLCWVCECCGVWEGKRIFDVMFCLMDSL